MKKIALSLSIVVAAIFAFFYVQLQQAKSLLLEQLAQHDISKRSSSLIVRFELQAAFGAGKTNRRESSVFTFVCG